MTRKWTTQAVPTSVIKNEYYNRDNLLTGFDKLFDDMFRDNYPDFYKSFGIAEPFSKASFPKVNVASFDNRIEIEAEISGYNKEDISVQVEEGILSIAGKASQTSEQTDKPVYLIRELKRSSFTRSFKLSDVLDADKIDATFKDGLLKLVIPKKEPVKPESKVNKVVIK